MQQGLLSQPIAAQGGTPAPAQNQPQPAQGASGASPEEQQMYDTLVGQTTEYIYGQGLESVKQRLQKGAEDGVEDDIGAIVGNLLAMNYQSAMEAQRTIPPMVMAGAAKELTELVTDISVEMRLTPQGEADNVADDALYVAMDTLGQAIPDMPQEHRQIYQQLLQQLEASESEAKGWGQPQAAGQGGMPT